MMGLQRRYKIIANTAKYLAQNDLAILNACPGTCRVSKAVLWTGLAVFTAQVVLYARLTFWELSW